MFDDLKRSIATTPKQEEDLLRQFGEFSDARKMLEISSDTNSKAGMTAINWKGSLQPYVDQKSENIHQAWLAHNHNDSVSTSLEGP